MNEEFAAFVVCKRYDLQMANGMPPDSLVVRPKARL